MLKVSCPALGKVPDAYRARSGEAQLLWTVMKMHCDDSYVEGAAKQG